MKIAYFSYVSHSVPALIRSFELTNAVASLGCTVTLCLFNKRISQPGWIFRMLEKSATERFRIVYKKTAQQGPTPAPSAKLTTSYIIKVFLKSLRYVPREIAFLRSFKPDVVVARPDQVFSFVISCKLLLIPLVLCTDGPMEELAAIHGFSPRWPIRFDAWRARRARSIMCISEPCRRLWIDKGIPEDNLFMCPNGVDPEVFAPRTPQKREALRLELGIKEKDIVIGFAGNQEFWHGLPLLVERFAHLAQADRRLHLLVSGRLKDPTAAGDDAVTPAVRHRVHFTGMVEYGCMPDYLDAMDIFVMPYPPFELFHFSPMKMFEALSMGKCIVASAQGQIAEMLNGVPSAFLYDARDEKGLENALGAAIKTFVNSPRLGNHSRAFILENHTWRKRGETLLAACRHALESKG